MGELVDLEQKRAEKRQKKCQDKFEAMSPMMQLVTGPILKAQGVITEPGKSKDE